MFHNHSKTGNIIVLYILIFKFLVLTPIYLRYILTLSSHLCFGLPRSLFPVGLSLKILKALLPSSNLATCPDHTRIMNILPINVHRVFVNMQYFQ